MYTAISADVIEDKEKLAGEAKAKVGDVPWRSYDVHEADSTVYPSSAMALMGKMLVLTKIGRITMPDC